MGTDIHVYPEFHYEGKPDWESLSGQFHLARDYNLFKRLGVRGGEPMFPLKGLPSDLGDEAREDCFVDVEDHRDHPDWRLSRDHAERLVAEGRTFWSNENQVQIADLDWHSFTWLTTNEFREVVAARIDSDDAEIDPCYLALVAAMDELERHNCVGRLVLWFDN